MENRITPEEETEFSNQMKQVDRREGQKAKYLLSGWARFVIATAEREDLKLDREIQPYAATLELSSRLYVCGGGLEIYRRAHYVSSLFSISYEGRSTLLQPMKCLRRALSLSGLPPRQLIGGFNKESISTCEEYSVTLNNWKQLPPLNIARELPGSILPSSRMVFCFGGIKADHPLNSIETL